MIKTFLAGSFLVIATLILVVPSTKVEAATLYIDPGTSALNRGDSLTMAIRLDTDESINECINAVDAVITYSENIEPVDVSVGDSIFNIWVERPVINKSDRTITFAGGIPNGYCGRVIGDPRLTNILAKIIFRSPGFTIGSQSSSTAAFIELANNSTAYLNDGRGTKAQLVTYGAKIELSDKAGSTLRDSWREEVAVDEIPPVPFAIEMVHPRLEANNKYYIVFNTTDKQTGIDHYEVIEEPLSQFGSFRWGRADAPWLEKPSPYVLKDQTLNSIIRVKAIDKAGNEYIAHLIPEESLRTTSQDKKILFAGAGVILVVIILSVLFVALSLRRRRKEKITTGLQDDELTEVDNLEN